MTSSHAFYFISQSDFFVNFFTLLNQQSKIILLIDYLFFLFSPMTKRMGGHPQSSLLHLLFSVYLKLTSIFIRNQGYFSV